MLLLVMETEFEDWRHLAPDTRLGLVDEAQHRRRHMVAIGADGVDRRARQKASLGARMARADRLVIGIEQVGEGRVERPVGGIERRQDKGLEKPAGVRQMPLCRADIGHRLDRLVLGRQVGGEPFAVAADRGKALACRRAIVVTRRQLDGCIEQLASPARAA